MSINVEDVGKLVEKINELLVVLNGVTEDLQHVSSSLKSLASQIGSPEPQKAIPVAPIDDDKETSNNKVKMMFPEDLAALLNFEEKEEYIIVRPRQFLGVDNFARIASIVREMSGEYISDGKNSHFRIHRKRKNRI
jgi:hypothetical protein